MALSSHVTSRPLQDCDCKSCHPVKASSGSHNGVTTADLTSFLPFAANLVRSGFSNGSDAVPRQQSYDSTSSPGASSSAGTRNGTPGVPRREGNGIAHPQAQAASYAQSNARASTASSLAWAPPRATGASPTADSKKVSPYRAPARGLHPAPPPHEDAATYGLALLQRAVNGDHGELEP